MRAGKVARVEKITLRLSITLEDEVLADVFTLHGSLTPQDRLAPQKLH
jgi:hypothetical protein